eukprot:g31930.t1
MARPQGSYRTDYFTIVILNDQTHMVAPQQPLLYRPALPSGRTTAIRKTRLNGGNSTMSLRSRSARPSLSSGVVPSVCRATLESAAELLCVSYRQNETKEPRSLWPEVPIGQDKRRGRGGQHQIFLLHELLANHKGS